MEELTINPVLVEAMPPHRDIELRMLKDSLMAEGCRNALVVYKNMLVDGIARYQICIENNIPFETIEMNFESIEAAKLWRIKTQLAQRNLPDFVRCELVLPFEEQLKAEAKKKQGTRNDLNNKNLSGDVVPILEQCKGPTRTLHKLAEMAGVSNGTMDKAKKIAESDDEDLKDQVRKGNISINKAFQQLKLRETPLEGKPLPGYGLVVPIERAEDVSGVIAPDIEISLETQFTAATNLYVSQILVLMNSIKGDVSPFAEIINNGYKTIMEKIGGNQNEK